MGTIIQNKVFHRSCERIVMPYFTCDETIRAIANSLTETTVKGATGDGNGADSFLFAAINAHIDSENFI